MNLKIIIPILLAIALSIMFEGAFAQRYNDADEIALSPYLDDSDLEPLYQQEADYREDRALFKKKKVWIS